MTGHPLVLAIVSGKGGVGKTALAVNLAVGLGDAGRVVLFDGDSGLANAHILLGVRPTLSIADALRGEASIDQVAEPTPWGIDLVAGSSGAPELLRADEDDRRALGHALETLFSHYDIAIIDCPAGADDSALRHTELAGEIVVVLTGEPTSFLDAYSTLKELSNRYRRSRFNVVLNSVEGEVDAVNLFSRFHAVTTRFLDIELCYLGYVRRDSAVDRAIRRCTPLLADNAGPGAAADIAAIARRVAALTMRSAAML